MIKYIATGVFVKIIQRIKQRKAIKNLRINSLKEHRLERLTE